jgi:hypothetical protein
MCKGGKKVLKEKITRKSDYRKFSRQELTDRLLHLEGEVKELENYFKRRLDNLFDYLNQRLDSSAKKEVNKID